MSKTKIDGTSDYAKVLDELKYYKKLASGVANINETIDKAISDKQLAENTLKKVQDYINSNEEIAHFHSLKNGFNKLIEDYFKKVK
ncbi:MAG: hypothetical protein J6T74_01125 [Clostridia bacterium]|nr:hypothetical protein [Clostridia bacterium]